jgi:hypothetical protein
VADLERLAESIMKQLPAVKSGTLRLWGQSFGRPGEDRHTLIGCAATEDCLRLQFAGDEVLALWNPIDVRIDASQFRVGSATAMRYTYYGNREKLPGNIRYRDYAFHNGLVIFRTNENRVPGSGWMPEETASTSPAVELTGTDFRLIRLMR